MTRTKIKKQIYDLLRESVPLTRICYCAGQYSKVVEGAQCPISKEEAFKTLREQPKSKILFFIIDERRLNLTTREYVGAISENKIPDELMSYKVQKFCCDSRETMTTLIEIQSGITKNN